MDMHYINNDARKILEFSSQTVVSGTDGCSATVQTRLRFPEVRGFEEIWRTVQCMFPRYGLLQFALVLCQFFLCSSILLHLKQRMLAMSSVQVTRRQHRLPWQEMCGRFTVFANLALQC